MYFKLYQFDQTKKSIATNPSPIFTNMVNFSSLFNYKWNFFKLLNILTRENILLISIWKLQPPMFV
jgi:hypothetical protein